MEQEIKKKIKNAIKFVGTNPRSSGGWVDEVLNPYVENLYQIFLEFKEFKIK